MHSNTQRKIILFILLLGVLWDTGLAIYISHTEQVKNVGEVFVVICRGEGQRVEWSGPNGILGTRTKPTVNVATYGTRLLFNGTRAEDSGTYKCTDGKAEKTFKLIVTAPIQFKDSPPIQEVKEGDDTVIRCEVIDGEVSWATEDGQELNRPKYQVIGDGLLIKNVTREDDRIYLCKGVQLKTGNVKDRRIRLHVLFAPEYYNHYEQQITVYGYIGGITELNCQITAKPKPKFTWYDKRKRKINYSESIYRVYVDKNAFGEYKCEASNQMGKLDKHFTLERGTKPDPPISFELDEAHSDSFDLTIVPPEVPETIDNIMEPKLFNVQYRVVKKNEEEQEDQEMVEWEAQEFNITEENTYSLVDLQPSTDYEVRAATKNLAGLSDFTNSSIFTTEPSGTQALFNPCILLNIIMFNLCILLIGN